MPVAPALIAGAATVGGGLLSSSAAKSAARDAAAAQTAASQAAIAQQDKQYTQTRNDLMPFQQAGTNALAAQMDLLGLGGHAGAAATPGTSNWTGYLQSNPDVLASYFSLSPGDRARFQTPEAYAQYHYTNYGQSEGRALPTTGGTPAGPGVSAAEAQQQAIGQLQQSPLYQSLFNNGRDTILANASATGGLRGGNVQSSLANFGRDTLAQVIQTQLSNLGGVAASGQNAAAQTGTLGAQNSSAISQLLTQQGQAQSGAALASGAASASAYKDIAATLGGLANNKDVTSWVGKLF